ncbi:MAG TPA: replication-associated recombination protein A [Phycisphaerae bacterium]|nr:replication-associated recombination protein A [Phycisphaerae bacterium]HRR85930.1 replication-associated recombination protein A [Phycisphaerae bacterium]
MDLFSQQRKDAFNRVQPLAVSMRPRTLEEFVGQEHFLGPGKLLRRLLAADRLSSAIFYGPPGTGKTTLAHIIAGKTQAAFIEVNAAAVGVKEVRGILEEAKERLASTGKRTVLFLDEIHRFNRAQQDILLNDVENGLIILIGATTENPFFTVNSPLVSRSQIFQFEPLTKEHIRILLRRAVADPERGLGRYKVEIQQEAIEHWATTCDGDARRALLAMEVAVLSQIDSTTSEASNPIVVDLKVAEESIQRKAITYDGSGDEHYDAASALIKSMRGSDPDAAVYWLARMLEAGEDPRFIARRVAICAAEDVGNADPHALVVANAAAQVTLLVGMPECQLVLSQAVIYIACAPKSNASAAAIWTATKDVREARTIPVPKHLRDSHYRGAARMGHGTGYKYAHDYQGGFVEQDYLGVDKTYYTPTDRGHEAVIRAYLASLANQTEKRPGGPLGGSKENRPREIGTDDSR